MALTAVQLNIIDLCVLAEGASPQPSKDPPWFTSAYTTQGLTPDLEELNVIGFAIVRPLAVRSPLRKSKWVCVRTEEGLRVVPELHLRALTQFSSLDPEQIPYWLNGVESGEVGLASRVVPQGKRINKYGFPPGSKEYHQAWVADNKERQRLASKKYAQRQRDMLRMLKDAVQRQDTAAAEVASTKRVTAPAPAAKIDRKKKEPELSPVEALALKLGVDPAKLAPAAEQEFLPPCPRCGNELGGEQCDWCGWPNRAESLIID